MTTSLRSAFVALLIAFAPLAAQDETNGTDTSGTDPRQTAPAERVGVIATVNGTAITVTDVAHRMREMREQIDLRGVDNEQFAHEARRMLAEEILLAAEAVRRGLAMSERQVVDYWTRRLGQRPDFEAIALHSGTTVQRQKELARRAALAEQFIELRTSPGLLQGSPVTPDPTLVRLMTITPKQLRDEFRSNRERYNLPDRITLAARICRDAESAELVRRSVIDGTPPTRGSQLQREMHPIDELDKAFSPDMANFLRNAQAGEVSQVFPLEVNAVFFELEERLPAKTADFAEVQAMLRAQLEMARRRQAREILVRELEMEAACWPADVFDDPR